MAAMPGMARAASCKGAADDLTGRARAGRSLSQGAGEEYRRVAENQRALRQLRRMRAGLPNQAIAMGETIYVIDPARCTECVGHFDEPQCVVVCPVECIDPDPEIVETEDQLLAKLRQLQHDHPELYAEPPSE
jgi:ferredoxin